MFIDDIECLLVGNEINLDSRSILILQALIGSCAQTVDENHRASILNPEPNNISSHIASLGSAFKAVQNYKQNNDFDGHIKMLGAMYQELEP